MESIGVARGGGGGGSKGPATPPIEMLSMIKMSQKRYLFIQFQFLLASSRTTVHAKTVFNNNIDPGDLGSLNLIFINQFKWPSFNNV